MELNFNWSKVNSSSNLASWFMDKERETICVTAYNVEENNKLFKKHQPGGTGMLCQLDYLQYARKPMVDPRGLRRWCSWPFFCNPNHVTRIVVAYQPCASKTEGLKTVYQQHLRYIQSRGLPFNPVDLFDHGLSKQIKEWRGKGERIILMMDINDCPLQNKLYTKLKVQNIEMEEFAHKCWGQKELYEHRLGKSPIDGGYKSSEVEVVNLSMLIFAECPGDHWSFVFDISARSLLGVYRYKVCQLVSWHLVTLQKLSVKKNNKIIREQFKKHCIQERMNMVDNMTRHCKYPLSLWLCSMIIIQTVDGDQNSCGKELQEDSAAGRQLQPNNSNVVQQNRCLSPAHKDEGGKNEQHQKHLMLCTALTHQQTRRINDEEITERAKICKDQKSRPLEAGQRAQKGPPTELSNQCNGEKAETMRSGNQTKNQQIGQQTDVVPHQTNGERPIELKRIKSPKSHRWQSKRVRDAGGRQRCYPTRMQCMLLSGTQCTNDVNATWQMPMLPLQ
jgi:hypothetical protein